MDASFCDIGGESRTEGGRYIVEASYNSQTLFTCNLYLILGESDELMEEQSDSQTLFICK